jgi:Asp-tRNA(Asn)/Glu-tRNA(Gln) amidotransferase A subunit family amidase
MSALDLPLREQAAGIASGEVDPGELLDACLDRIEERNPDLNAVVATFPDQSREMLETAPDGPLHGVPVLIKDEWPLPWRAETVGAATVRGVTLKPGESGPYRALRDAGAVIAGIANMHELGSSSTGNTSLYGAAHNPWDLERCPGGSSSGPAAAVAGGIVSGAVGADGLGSVRYPAAYCGLTGLKPTFGRAAMDGHHIANTETIVSGPLCRDAADARLLASVLFGEEVPADQPKGLRIGVIRDPFWSDSAPGVREACEAALESLRSEVGGEVVEVELPDLDLILPAALLVAQAEEAAHLVPGQSRGPQAPCAAAAQPDRAGIQGPGQGSPRPGGALRRDRPAGLAGGARRRPLAHRADDRAPVGGGVGRCRQRAPGRDREPDRRSRCERPGRARRRNARGASAARRLGLRRPPSRRRRGARARHGSQVCGIAPGRGCLSSNLAA